MDEEKTDSTPNDVVATDAVPKRHSGSEQASATPATAALPALDLNELQNLSSEQLESLARDFDLRLHSARSRHQHIVDIIRAALNRGSSLTPEGFLNKVGDQLGLLRFLELNFLRVPEVVCVLR